MKYTFNDVIEYGDNIKLKSNTIIETGKIYGALKVIAPARIKNERKIFWHCKCSCGADCFYVGSELRSGKRTSCGSRCNNIKNEIGTTYGYLEVVEKDNTSASDFADNSVHWICKCNLCGAVKSISGKLLRNGQAKSCGCLKSYGEQLISKYLQDNGYSFIKEYYFNDLKGEKEPLRFDFAIFNNNKLQYLIEFQGAQHFIYEEYFGSYDKFLLNQKYDKDKEEYCNKYSIPLLKIIPNIYRQSSTNYANLPTIINEFEQELKENKNVKIFNKYL